MEAIQRSTSIRWSLEELYQAVENMCSHKMSIQLYDQLKDVCDKHIRCNVEQFKAYPLKKFLFSFQFCNMLKYVREKQF